jgi:hypothetical protein
MKNGLIILLASSMLMACKQEGCTDPSAFNYSAEAEKDDASCTYNGYVTFWFTSVTATNLVNASIPNVDFYIDGEQVGSVSVTQFSVNEPTCGGSEGFTATVFLGTSNSVTKNYQIKKGGTSTVLQMGTVLATNPLCHWVQLTY